MRENATRFNCIFFHLRNNKAHCFGEILSASFPATLLLGGSISAKTGC